jgi:hypothetical protein
MDILQLGKLSRRAVPKRGFRATCFPDLNIAYFAQQFKIFPFCRLFFSQLYHIVRLPL